MDNIWGDNNNSNENSVKMKSFLNFNQPSSDITLADYLQDLIKRPDSYYQFRDIITAGCNILEAGCGIGDNLIELKFLTGENGSVTGIDLNETLLAEAKTKANLYNLNINTQSGNIYQLAFPDNHFDIVCCKRTLQHLESPDKALNELLRVLKINGTLILIEPDRGTCFINAEDRNLTRVILANMEEVIKNPWIGRQLKGLLEKHKLADINLNLKTITHYNFNSADMNFGFNIAVDGLISIGRIPAELGKNWLADLHNKDSDKSFLCGITLFMISGRKVG